MNSSFKKAAIFIFLLLLLSCNPPRGNENSIVSIQTTMGNIRIKLYDATPIHRNNFIKLINSGFYDGISFHRVIKEFMIQAGDPLTKSGSKTIVADSLTKYTIPPEFNPNYFHKKGALAAARQGNDVNPEMRSSGTQFYIVQGIKYTDDELNQSEQRINANIKQALFNRLLKVSSDSLRTAGKTITDSEIQEIASVRMFNYLSTHNDYKIGEDQRNIYKTVGGTPRLDATYTVFGEVVEGLDVVDKIAAVPTDKNDKPLTDVKIIKIKVVKN